MRSEAKALRTGGTPARRVNRDQRTGQVGCFVGDGAIVPSLLMATRDHKGDEGFGDDFPMRPIVTSPLHGGLTLRMQPSLKRRASCTHRLPLWIANSFRASQGAVNLISQMLSTSDTPNPS